VGDGRDHLLVTGAAGRIGAILVDAFSGDYAVHGLDVVRGQGVERIVDVTSPSRLAPTFEGMRAVVDLAANASVSASWDSVLTNNVPATVAVLEAARAAGVPRVVFASSNHVVGLYERDEPYASIVTGSYDGLEPGNFPFLGGDVPLRPDGPYGVGKALGEAAARYYAESFGLSVLCLRIGTVNHEDRPTSDRQFATLLTHRDLIRLVRCCLEAPEDLAFGVYYGVSANTWRFWDLEQARRDLGYVPEDDAEQWRER
jgi:nucleoside-diphosphate-sugar epimerase